MQEVSSLIISAFTYYASNALAFYSINPKSEKGCTRRARIINSYGILAAFLFICLSLNNSLKWDIAIRILGIILQIIVFLSAFIAPCYALKDDEDYDPKVLKEIKKRTQENLEKEKMKKVYSNRDRNVSMNRQTKEFIEENDRKIERGWRN
jgi:hypothetical protein